MFIRKHGYCSVALMGKLVKYWSVL